MLEFPNGGRLVQSTSELPDLRNARLLYADFETTSCNDELDSLNPWHHCWAAGLAVTVDDAPGAWYVPLASRHGGNLPLDAVARWWSDVLDTCGRWINHSVKYDAHVSVNSLGVEPPPSLPLECTIVGAKLVDSDRFRYGLDHLSRDWLCEDISDVEKAIAPYLHRCQDYGNVPADVITPYACQDVITNRRLRRYIAERTPADVHRVRDMEVAMTSVLLRMEQRGFLINPVELMLRELAALKELERIETELELLIGKPFRPHVNNDCFDVLCCQYGLPVLAWTEGEEDDGKLPEDRGGPSFDKEALAAYSVHPDVTSHPVLRQVLPKVRKYRSVNTLRTLFLRPWQEQHVSGVMHPTHNQLVRTGRMSCGQPNAQQLSPAAKALVHPRPGHTFVAIDDAQAEYRLIVNLIENQEAIEAYNRDPDTDFHQHVADMITELTSIKVSRKPAKTLNFLMGYGGGKKRLLRALEGNAELVGEHPPDERRRRAQLVYDAYHAAIPELKRTSRRAAAVAASRGYVRNLHGRRRHLPQTRAHHAFNTLNQGEAADIMKDRMTRLAVLLPTSHPDTHMLMQVHDELVLEVPVDELGLTPGMHEEASCERADQNSPLMTMLQEVMEDPGVSLLLPWRCSVGVSTSDWRAASKTGVPFPKKTATMSSPQSSLVKSNGELLKTISMIS